MDNPTLQLTIHHHGNTHSISLPNEATMQDLAAALASTFQIPAENQKLLIAPKPGMQKAPFPATRLTSILALDSPKLKITLLGTPTKDIDTLNTQAADTRRLQEARASALASAAATQQSRRSRNTNTGGIHTLSSTSSSPNNYTFHRLEPLPYLPNPSRSHTFLARLRDDPGIRAAMQKHRFSVPLLTEMDPAQHTTMESRTLGLNRNKGEVIELRLRTDAYDGYRDYRTIRKTLCHELAHCVFSEHDRDFWDLTAQIEREVERADWRAGGRRVVDDQEFYNPGDWEVEREGTLHVDERGWTGGVAVLGSSSSSSIPPSGGGGGMREVMARAAEERLRKAKRDKEEEDPQS